MFTKLNNGINAFGMKISVNACHITVVLVFLKYEWANYFPTLLKRMSPDLSWKILCCEEITPRTLQHLTTKLFLLQFFKLSVWSQYLSENIGLRNSSLYYRPLFCLQSTLAAMLFSLRRNKRCLIFSPPLSCWAIPIKCFIFHHLTDPFFQNSKKKRKKKQFQIHKSKKQEL